MSLLSHHIDGNRETISLPANSNAPWYGLPKPFPITVTWAVWVDATFPDDYGTCWSYGPDPYTGSNYYEAAIIPSGSAISAGATGATGPCWNLAIDGDHSIPSAQITLGRWYYQGWHAQVVGTTLNAEYYFDLPDLTKVISLSESYTGSYNFDLPSSSHSFQIGDNAWPTVASNETLGGYQQGYKIWQAYLSGLEIQAEALNVWPALPKYTHVLWDVLPLRTKYDTHITGINKINVRHWTFPGVEPSTGGLTAPLQASRTTWWYGDVLSGYFNPPVVVDALEWSGCYPPAKSHSTLSIAY